MENTATFCLAKLLIHGPETKRLDMRKPPSCYR